MGLKIEKLDNNRAKRYIFVSQKHNNFNWLQYFSDKIRCLKTLHIVNNVNTKYIGFNFNQK